MRKFFVPNLDRRGRVVRAIFGAGCIAGGVVLAQYSWWACAVLAVAGVFAFYEAARGWCIVRACGIKTRM